MPPIVWAPKILGHGPPMRPLERCAEESGRTRAGEQVGHATWATGIEGRELKREERRAIVRLYKHTRMNWWVRVGVASQRRVEKTREKSASSCSCTHTHTHTVILIFVPSARRSQLFTERALDSERIFEFECSLRSLRKSILFVRAVLKWKGLSSMAGGSSAAIEGLASQRHRYAATGSSRSYQ